MRGLGDPGSPHLTFQPAWGGGYVRLAVRLDRVCPGEQTVVMILNGRPLLCCRESWATWPAASLRWFTAT